VDRALGGVGSQKEAAGDPRCTGPVASFVYQELASSPPAMKVTAPQPKERDWNVSTAPAITAIRNKIDEMLM